jgi:RNA polymerase sigma-70 factor (ECF subfamily)
MISEQEHENLRRWSATKAHRMLPAAEAEDAAQEAAVAIVEAVPRLREGADPWPFLTMVARQAISNYARRFYGLQEDALPEAADAPLTPSTEDLALSHLEPAPVVSERLLAALATLPARQREILEAGVMAGRSNVAAGAALGISEARVRKATQTALDHLRQTLGEAA